MKSRLGRTILTVIGAVAVLLGAVWVGQGANLIPGSFMTGDRTWFGIGLFVAAAGVGLLVLGLRRPKRDS